MADLSTASGVNYTKIAALAAKTGSMSDFVDGTNEWGTKLRVMLDTYTVPTGDTLHSDAVLTMGKLPKGARPLAFYFAQSGGGEAAVGTIKIGTTDVAGASVLTDMSSNTEQLVPALSTASDSVLTAASVVTITIATQDIDAATVLVLATFYLVED
ncbi:hypothetical protein LCGC14_2092040 [marine sediment metagenome]|uniref:Uncharacterized protein n=1 Tax=marine sediment metagenome TaxID=412755 RepID=A0A0F9ECM4_9ZZZZ